METSRFALQGGELTASHAVGALRRRLGAKEHRIARKALTSGKVALKTLLADFALLVLMVPFMFMFGVMAFLLYVALSALVLAYFVVSAMRACRPAIRDGVPLGKSYARHVLQYANSNSRDGNRYEMRGSDAPYMLDLLGEPNQHVLIAGSSSSGKTTTLKALLSRSSLRYGINFLAIDWQGELEDFARETGAALWRVPNNLMLNIFRLNSVEPMHRASIVEEGLMLALQLTQLQATRVRDALMQLYANGSEPDLHMLWSKMSEKRENRLIGYRLKAVERVIGFEPPDFWSSILSNNTIVSLSGLNDNEKSLVTYFILQRICELFEKGEMNAKPRLLIAIDEAWQLMASQQKLIKLPSAHEMLAEKIVRLGRKYGFGIVTSTQQLDDLPSAFINSSSVIVLHSYKQQWRNNILSLNALDIEYAKSAAQGECLVMDRLRAQKGQTWLDYVKVSPASKAELAQLRAQASAVQVSELQPSGEQISIETSHQVRKGRFSIPEGAPTPAEHAVLLAILANEDGEKAKIVSYIKERGWIGSDATIYGYRGNPGALEKTVKEGFAKEEGGKYMLTELGRKWVDPNYIMANQSDKLGSEEHKRLMAKTIAKLHESNMLVITSSEKHSPDLIAFPVSRAKSYLWDTASMMGYEVQTSARSDAIEMNEAKTGMPITWVASNQVVLDSIKQLTNSKDRHWLV